MRKGQGWMGIKKEKEWREEELGTKVKEVGEEQRWLRGKKE